MNEEYINLELLKSSIISKRKELEDLEKQLKKLEIKEEKQTNNSDTSPTHLTNEDILRYSRQLILPSIAVGGQLSLKKAKVLVVGCGGLGCPVAIYLAAAGVGTLGLVDYDVVEVSNLHRQVAHGMDTLGQNKCASLAQACKRLNSSIHTTQHCLLLTSSNALEVLAPYDIVVDATDNVPTRYLLSDACVLLGRKPLVSGSALKFDGQLTVYNHADSPCYRCIHPSPPPPNTVNNCSDGGVIGPVVGVIGCLQALEVVKIVTSMTPSYAGKLLVYDGVDGLFRTYRLRGRQSSCAVCGTLPSINSLQDYPLFCNSAPTDKDTAVSLLDSKDRISAQAYKEMLQSGERHLLLDVREPTELQICALPHPATNVRMQDLGKLSTLHTIREQLCNGGGHAVVVVVCRRGNNSQKAVECLKRLLGEYVVEAGCGDGGFGSHNNGNTINRDCNRTIDVRGIDHSNNDNVLRMVDIEGGLYAWKNQVDSSMPIY